MATVTTGHPDPSIDRRRAAYELSTVARSGLVDVSWYLQANPDVAAAGADPLVHYMTQGWREGRDPCQDFSTTQYLADNPDVRAAGVNPLFHYVTQGWTEGRGSRSAERLSTADGRNPLTVLRALGEPPAAVMEPPHASLPPLAGRALRPASEPPVVTPLRTVAFYLPQFHPIPENDAWWGSGFTEWTHVRGARPQYAGHRQPRVPGELGYYDLRDPAVMARQSELARLHGVEAWCIYAYWFGGARLLEQPLDLLLEHPEIDISFSICWANENWTRTWDGEERDVLMGQTFDAHDDERFIEDMAKYLRDPRYVRVAGRPLLVVYRPSLLPDPRRTAETWRRWCRQHGLGEIALAYVQAFERPSPASIGFDYAIEFPPNNTAPTHAVPAGLDPSFVGSCFGWAELAERSKRYSSANYPLWRGVCPGWDNVPRRGERGTILHGATPDGFRDWLMNAGRDTVARFDDPSERLVFVNAWNEWAEGAYLEPDADDGYQALHAVRDVQQVLAGHPPGGGQAVVVVTHDMHAHGAQLLALALVKELIALGRTVEVVALGDGELDVEFSAAAPTHRCDPAGADEHAADRLAASLVGRGFRTAFCNSSMSGAFARSLKRHGAWVTGLVHEMKQVLSEPVAAARALALADASDELVFPSEVVQRDFEASTGWRGVTRVRSQGLYMRVPAERERRSARESVRRALGLTDSALIVLGVGYGDHRKGLDLFAEAAAIFDGSGQDVHFVWLGKLDTYDARITDALHRSRGRGLRLPGFVADPAHYYLAADALALSSREDPFPSVALEALSVGVPLVAFADRTGMNDLITRTGGTLVEPVSAAALVAGVEQQLSAAAGGQQEMRMRLVREEYNQRRYAFDLLSTTPAALPRVSVVLPNYNYGPRLQSRIEQILGQTYPVYELIVLDDCSTDDSVAVIEAAIADTVTPTRVIINDVNSGSPYLQWARGVDASRGDLVWIAEADDWADPELLATLVPEFVHPHVVLAYTQSAQLDITGRMLAPDYAEYLADVTGRDWHRRYTAGGLDEIAQCLSIKNTIPNVSAVLFRREPLQDALVEVQDVVADFATAADWLIYMRVLQRGDVVYHPETLSGHTRHAASVIGRGMDAGHLDEVARLQQRARTFASVPGSSVVAATAYLERIRRQLEVKPAR
ncbi:MAG: glycoside hydrolase family 99-like domain-containing protein [Frankiaceae bacterium]|nr:glycoside hydrolase family 99-like domain-containing protein [Frankiaceae bacterium]